MQRYVNVKARVKDLDEVKRKAESLSQTNGLIIKQRDVFFYVSSGKEINQTSDLIV